MLAVFTTCLGEGIQCELVLILSVVPYNVCSVFLYVCISVCMHFSKSVFLLYLFRCISIIYVCLYLCLLVFLYVCLSVYMYVCIYVYVCLYVYVCMCVCMYVCVCRLCVCMYVCVYVYVCMS